MSECEHASECENVDKSCRRCFNYNMFRPKKEVRRLGQRSGAKKSDKEGMAFEERGTKKYNQAIRQAKDVARRQFASGALYHSLGDMITEEDLTAALAEFKERGTLSKSGEKQITIKKEWLDKLEEEARLMNRDFYFLPFTFKGQNTDYVVMTYDRMLAYIQTIQILNQNLRHLQDQLNAAQAD
ncbi:hypothetical protein TCA2_4442 [Paenibacillus sp. TCA20]|uniref:Uncharacterized protein n=1 Tax=Paenibacillus urinalis TaxID=521520 RepID=A0ABY7XHD5_9BACL|nr:MULTISPECIES: hypothetical protein [Paenibacillus]WDI05221.1 hypothetical protein PUW25_25775 [Paenibacillus urinalis]GAK41950.1 hypothetical protein TCA2_4442 [Paenibacillus sp. TCA20]